jgi:hypothetical protein
MVLSQFRRGDPLINAGAAHARGSSVSKRKGACSMNPGSLMLHVRSCPGRRTSHVALLFVMSIHLLACAQHLSTQSVAQTRDVLRCLEEQGERVPFNLGGECRDAVWKALARAESEAKCSTSVDCLVFAMPPADGPCWNVTNKHWLTQAGGAELTIEGVVPACGRVESDCYPRPPPAAYCEAGRCRLRDYPRIKVPAGFTCPAASL